jgi:predicted translin family RNA/ssDNA-binding protein
MLDNVRAEYKSLQNVIKKLKKKLSKREQWEYRYFWNDGEQDIYEITSIKDWPITYRKDSTWKWVADWEPPYVLC